MFLIHILLSALKVITDAASMQNVSIMMVVTHVNVMRDTDQRPKKHLKYGWHTGEITRAVLISMNAKIARSMIAILKLRSVFEFFFARNVRLLQDVGPLAVLVLKTIKVHKF